MQRLKVKTKDDQGREAVKYVTVIRTWTDADGMQIHLHTDGVYGYKDGSPVRTKEELENIPQEDHRDMALAWWNNGGKKRSAEHYRALREKQKARISDYSPTPAQAASDLDQTMYHRYPAAGGKPKELPPAQPWMQFFAKRPDWWGQAAGVSFDEWTYERAASAKTRREVEKL